MAKISVRENLYVFRVASEASGLIFYIYHGKDDENASSHIFSSFDEISDLVFDFF